MLAVDEKYLEQASKLEQSQREALIQTAHNALAQPGQLDCEFCGKPIPEPRRLALPSAIRCVRCQQNFEFKKGLGL